MGEFIGLGGQAFVFACVCRERQCAAKVFDLDRMSTCERDPIDCEVNALKRVGAHPNIVEFMGSYQADQWRFVVMELVDGGSLHTQVFSHGRLNEYEARHTFRQTLMAVGYIHSRGMIHRDLKLKNILISSKSPAPGYGFLYELKLIDFGLCGHYPQAHTRVGTALFAAPEVTDQTYDYAADFWSLGVVLFCTLCGHFPVDDPAHLGGRLQAVMAAGVLTDPHPNSPWYGLTQEAKQLIRGMLTVEWDHWYTPKARYGLGECRRSPWVESEPPDWPVVPMLEPPNPEPVNEITLQKVQVVKEEAHGCFIGSIEDAKKDMPFFDDAHAKKCLNIGRRFKVQVMHIRRTRDNELEWLGRPAATTVLHKGDWVYYACRRTLPLGQPPCAAADLQFGEFEEVCSADRCDVKQVIMDCYSFTVPEDWNNCVLGGPEQAANGQGFLDFRNNWIHLTVAAILPGADEAGRQTVLFPGGSDVVRRGDSLLFPRRFKDLVDDGMPMTGKEREAMQDATKRSWRALRAKQFTDPSHWNMLCQQGKMRRAVD